MAAQIAGPVSTRQHGSDGDEWFTTDKFTRANMMVLLKTINDGSPPPDVANNVELAAEDPLADPPANDVPQVQLSLLCTLPAFQTNGTTAATNGHQNNSGGVQLALPLRAPP